MFIVVYVNMWAAGAGPGNRMLENVLMSRVTIFFLSQITLGLNFTMESIAVILNFLI